MSYLLTIVEQPGYLHFKVSGTNSLAAVRGYLTEIHAACAARQCPTILIEENLSGPSLAVGEIFQVAAAGSEATAPVIATIAYVDTNLVHDFRGMQFAETVAVTRGIDIRVFESVPAAQAWLKERIDSKQRNPNRQDIAS
jgi:hypothetical protein